jgi:hypothetical protein
MRELTPIDPVSGPLAAACVKAEIIDISFARQRRLSA